MATSCVRHDESCACIKRRKMSGSSSCISSPASSDGNLTLFRQPAADHYNSTLLHSCKSNEERTTASESEISRHGTNCASSKNHKKKVRKRKSRAKPKAPIKELMCADKLTFRDLVHHHTGLLQPLTSTSSSPSLPQGEASSFPAFNISGGAIHAYEHQHFTADPACHLESIFNYMSTAADPLSSSSSSAAATPPAPSRADPCFYNAEPATAKAATVVHQLITQGALNVSPNNYLMLACVLLRHITSELYSKCLLP
ncbi:hypothetical protein L7F22_012335 [Adiantum nelumboides]|nr:hypothetical protein [Adiantum nelumboides]